jgi:hypothetical protein
VAIDWLLYPLVLACVCAGQGLLVRRLTGGPPSNLLLLPVGFAASIVLTSAAIRIGSLHDVAWLALVGPAVAGVGLTLRPGRGAWAARRRGVLVPASVGIAAFVAYGAPVLLSGHDTFSGYSIIVDLGHYMDYSSWLVAHGYHAVAPLTSSWAQVGSGLVTSGYPIGLGGILGGTSELFGRELAWMYQPTLAYAGAMAGLAAYGLLGRFGLPLGLRAVGGFVCVQPNLLYAYAAAGGYKELFGLTLVLVTAAVLAELPAWRPRALLTVVFPVAAAHFVFGLTVAPWTAAVVAVFGLAFVLSLAGRTGWPRYWRLSGRNLVAAAVLLVVCCLGVRYAQGVSVPGIVTDQAQLGNLAAPTSEWATVGVWLSPDVRYGLASRIELTYSVIGMVILLGAVGTVWFLRERITAGLAVVVAALGTLLLLVPRTGPWLDFKAYCINGGLALLAAFGGIAALRRTSRAAAWLVALGLGAAVVYGNALTYHNTTLAPDARLRELASIDHQFAGQGPTLAPAFDEFAEYFLHDVDATGRVDPLNGVFPADALMGADIGQVSTDFVEAHPLLVLRRGADRTRPPSNYALVRSTHFYDVWKRVASPAGIKLHVTLPYYPNARPHSLCRSLAHEVAATHAPIVKWAIAPTPYIWRAQIMAASPSWQLRADNTSRGMNGAGRADVAAELDRTARYQVWITGSFQREVRLLVDGRVVGRVSDEADYPGEQHLAGSALLSAGSHTLSVVSGGGSLAPATGWVAGNRFFSAVYLRRAGQVGGRIFSASPARTRAICESHRPLTWVEAVTAT